MLLVVSNFFSFIEVISCAAEAEQGLLYHNNLYWVEQWQKDEILHEPGRQTEYMARPMIHIPVDETEQSIGKRKNRKSVTFWVLCVTKYIRYTTAEAKHTTMSH